jgi:uncharacterized ferritin-like protein (DUF455 family)
MNLSASQTAQAQEVAPETTPVTTPETGDWFSLETVEEKIRTLPDALAHGLSLTQAKARFHLGRDVRVVPVAELPPKPGFGSIKGQARLLHDLASIELQATELAVRTLHEFPDAPHEFRHQLAEIALEEGRHLELCMKGLEQLGFRWGHWDVHLALWNMVSHEDTLLDRILIVHRYLEGSGLDAGDSILRRLTGAEAKGIRDIVNVIVSEEVDHVLFGSRWYKWIAEKSGIDPERDFVQRIGEIARSAPRRERLARELRRKAGFTDPEMNELERCQEFFRQPLKVKG